MPNPPEGLRAWGPWLALVAVLGVVLLPLLLVEIPALNDYPNHIAGLHVLSSRDSDPALSGHYGVEWTLQPNLASQLIAAPLLHSFSAYEVGRLLVALALALPLMGTFLLYWALHGRFDYWPVAASLFLYNHVLAIGVLNYVIAMGLMLIGLAAWLRLKPKLPWAALSVGVVTGLALYVAHLFAFACYALAILLHAFWQAREVPWSERRRKIGLVLFALLPAIPPAVLMLTIPVKFSGGYTSYGGIEEKLVALLTPTLLYGTALDYVIFAVVYLGLVRLFVSRQLVVVREMRLVLLGLVVAAVLMPNYLGGLWPVDWRLPALIALMLIAATRLQPRSPAVPRLIAGVAIVLLLCRVWSVGTHWRAFDAHYAEFRHAAQALPSGARLLTVENGPDATRPAGFIRYPYVHISALAVIERSAFVPTLFTISGPVHARERNRGLNAPSGVPLPAPLLLPAADAAEAGKLGQLVGDKGMPYFWAAWPRHFDHVVWLHYGAGAAGVPEGYLVPVSEGSFFTLYRVTGG